MGFVDSAARDSYSSEQKELTIYLVNWDQICTNHGPCDIKSVRGLANDHGMGYSHDTTGDSG